nr:hypothetical protein [Candidatus Competibacter phosphatis]
MDERVITTNGKHHSLGRAVDQEGYLSLVQRRRPAKTAQRFFRQ